MVTRLTPKCHFVLGLLQFWGPITLCADLLLKWGLNQSCNPCWDLFNNMLHATYTQGNKGDSWLLVVGSQIAYLSPIYYFSHNSQLLEGLKCESKWKTTEEGGVGMRSLAHNTWRGRGACWSSEMGLGRIDKLIHSHGPAHNPHKVVSA